VRPHRPHQPLQVTDEHGRPGVGLIGVVFDARAATIYHTRALTHEDVMHEPLHVAHPTWTVHATTLGWRDLVRSPVLAARQAV
jgi:hypothetical protein